MDTTLAFPFRSHRPAREVGAASIGVVDLFSGAGGLTLGLAEAARLQGLSTRVALAVDFEEAPVAVFRRNFPAARVPDPAGVETYFNGALGDSLTATERSIASEVGTVDWLHGGPPCQGHSNLNNHTRRVDSRNSLYARMARAAEVLRPRVVLIENVPSVVNDRGQVVRRTTEVLGAAGYHVADQVVALDGLGVPQTRRRHVLLAVRDVAVNPSHELGLLQGHDRMNLRWAIGDLVGADSTPLDTPSRPSPENLSRMNWLFGHRAFDLPNEMRPSCHQGDHSYTSVYGRLRWEDPAQTITSGYGSMGQGRYVHPSQRRTLTPHEAARIQYFPDWFDFTAGGQEMRRGAWATMIGDAVPPKLTIELGKALLPHLTV